MSLLEFLRGMFEMPTPFPMPPKQPEPEPKPTVEPEFILPPPDRNAIIGRMFDSLVPPEYSRARPEHVPEIKDVDFEDGGYGVVFSGPDGSGKTYAATALAWRYLDEVASVSAAFSREYLHFLHKRGQDVRKGYRCLDDTMLWTSASYLFARIRDTHYRQRFEKTEQAIIDECVAAKVMIIDDLYAVKERDFGVTTRDTILAGRRDHRRYTIITTEQCLFSFFKWNPRIYLRLMEMTSVTLPDRNRLEKVKP